MQQHGAEEESDRSIDESKTIETFDDVDDLIMVDSFLLSEYSGIWYLRVVL